MTTQVFSVSIPLPTRHLIAVTDYASGSEQMSLVQFFVPTEVAHDTVAELGELGNVQFRDVSVYCYFPFNLEFFSYLAAFQS